MSFGANNLLCYKNKTRLRKISAMVTKMKFYQGQFHGYWVTICQKKKNPFSHPTPTPFLPEMKRKEVRRIRREPTYLRVSPF